MKSTTAQIDCQNDCQDGGTATSDPHGIAPQKERPILFSGSMVQAILGGRKTQTRRVIKPQPLPTAREFVEWTVNGERQYRGKTPLWIACLKSGMGQEYGCPFGEKGSLLWVRETWAPVEPSPTGKLQYDGARLVEVNGYAAEIWYRADGELGLLSYCFEDGPRWKPSIHMPRAASRLTLEITGVRVERIQDISEEDAIAEGVPTFDWDDGKSLRPVSAFMPLWNSINQKRGYGWDSNPWVWAIEFSVRRQ